MFIGCGGNGCTNLDCSFPKEGPALMPGPAIGAGIPFGFCPLL